MTTLWNRMKRVIGGADRDDGPKFDLQPGDTDRMWESPDWLKRAGTMSWYLIGIAIAVLGLLALLYLTKVVVIPLIVAVILAILFSPAVAFLHRHGWSRGLGSVVVVLGLIVVGAAIIGFSIWSLVNSVPALQSQFAAAAGEVTKWLQDIGVDPSQATEAGSSANRVAREVGSFALSGVTSIISLVIGAFLAMFILLFLLSDYPRMKDALAGLFPFKKDIADAIVDDFSASTIGYFRALTVIGFLNGVVMVVAAMLMGVPLAGAIGIITFITSYIPFFGAFIAGGVAAIIALGSQGWEAALVLVIISILYNNVASNVIQPIAAGKTLDLHPLVILLATTIGGILFGLIGAILAAPIASAVAVIRKDFREARVRMADEPLDGAASNAQS